LLGFLVGAVIYGLTYQFVFPPIEAIAKVGNVVMPDLWNLNSFLFILLFALITVFLFYLIDRVGMQRKDKSE
jgi:prepilin signal peptidase PulO-like enzyme (type II secretory pathway)